MKENIPMFTIRFCFENGDFVVASASEGDSILELAQRHNVAIDAPCSGNASCGKCRVQLIKGEVKSEQTRHITKAEYAAGWRLACVSEVCADADILVPDIASAYRSRMKIADLGSGEEIAIFDEVVRSIQEAGIEWKNDFSILDLEMAEPTLEDTMPDNERLLWAARAATGVEIGNIHMTFSALKKLPDALRAAGFRVQCVVEQNPRELLIHDVIPAGEKAVVAGMAVDIGTTTVSALLVDLRSGKILAKASTGNGQIRYGADVINRIIESAKPGGRARLQNAIVGETLLPLLEGLCHKAHIPADGVYQICVASNTTMNHLLIGVNAEPVRMEPYIPAFFETSSVKASDLGIEVSSDAKVILAPNVGSYVGGDITAGTLASGIWNKPEFSLFIDLGTNGELVFGNEDFLMTCACSAGPAFEGGDISCGMRATDGAIEACVIDPETLEPTLTVVGGPSEKPVGLCGSGIIDAICQMFLTGIINAKGSFVKEGRRIRRNEHGVASYVLAFREEAGSVRDVEINEVDIDNFIRAKAAIFSGIHIMLASLDMDVSVIENIYVAGGIGSGINMKNAVMIGMLPDIPLEKYHYIGNSSLCGAYAMLLSDAAAEKVSELSKNMTYMELSTNPSYMDEFVAACFLPHTNEALFPSVAEEIYHG
ncbi:corrinoid activation/regeneration protein AcsV [Hominifimenecus sp. rT4P-3]|uniref:corrinoid activation/regeneration protein AcsV n=1 Tax=Hominifimenecus sp. rT4P-3 TaxID=3242979 RepID=UPI003DA30F54